MSAHETEYRKWRKLRPTMPAPEALAWARTEASYAAARARFGAWDWIDERGYHGAFASTDMLDPPTPYVVRVLVADDDFGVEWGDLEPTDEEREHARAYVVTVQVLEDGEEVYADSIGQVDIIDLPGYMTRDWEDAAAYALAEYLLDDALDFAHREEAERAYWAACDVVTVAA